MTVEFSPAHSRQAEAAPHPAERAIPMIHTIAIGSHVLAQGPLVAHLPDGRLVIEAGGRTVAGRPPAARTAGLGGWKGAVAAALFGLSSLLATAPGASAQTLLNVSYDPTREFYREYNIWFADWWVAQGNPRPTIQTSHGGSGARARAVIDGLGAHVVTLALAVTLTPSQPRRAAFPRTGSRACRTTPRPIPAQSCSWYVRATPRASRTGMT